MNIVFIGAVTFSEMALRKIHSLDVNITGICTLKESSFNSDFCDLSLFADDHNIPCLHVEDINSSETIGWIKQKEPDFIFCFGFSRLLKKEILELPVHGVLGYHPAELPFNRGRHPLIWALVLGMKQTGSTFFFMDEGADSGDILSQSIMKINDDDDAKSLYNKMTETALKQIEIFIPQLKEDNVLKTKQNHSLSNTWRKRTEKDGLIDWRMSAKSIHNLVRALTKPYLGAHLINKEKIIKVWKTEVLKNDCDNIEPGKVVSIDAEGCFTIKCGEDSVKIISAEPPLETNIGDYL